MKTFRPCLAEFLGTFYLCFAGISAILCNTPAVGGTSGLLGIALAHGLAISISFNIFGGQSDAHFLCFAGISAILCNTPAVGGTSGPLGIALAHGELAMALGLLARPDRGRRRRGVTV